MKWKLLTPKNTGTPDFALILVTLVLLSLGMVMVFSSSAGYMLGLAEGKDFTTNDLLKYLLAQMKWAGFGLLAMYVLSKVDHKFYRRYAVAFLGLVFISLVAVLIPEVGTTQKGASRWLNLGVISFQPSETAKLALAIFLATILAKRPLKTWRDLGLPSGVLLVFCALVVKQPDLGTTLVISATAVGILFAAGLHLRYFAAILAVGVLGILAVINSPNNPHMRERLMVWLDPWPYYRDEGYQIVNSLLALGSGGVFGVGLGRGMQKFGHVPENFTDMIFAIIGEELGLVGTTAVIVLFALFVWRGLTIAINSPEPFSRYLAAGITCMIAFQTILNLGVVSGLLPVTGVTLPFISYGGTSLTLNLASVGILLNISRYNKLKSD